MQMIYVQNDPYKIRGFGFHDEGNPSTVLESVSEDLMVAMAADGVMADSVHAVTMWAAHKKLPFKREKRFTERRTAQRYVMTFEPAE